VIYAYHKFVKTTPKPSATKNSRGDCVVLEGDAEDELEGDTDELVSAGADVGDGAGSSVDVAPLLSSLATMLYTSTMTSLMIAILIVVVAMRNGVLRDESRGQE
jgi:hypothetical protein